MDSANTGLIEKSEVTFIAGIAIILMVIHHMFGFEEYLRCDTNWHCVTDPYGSIIVNVLAGGGNICVSIFAFITGNAVGIQYEKYILFKYSYWKAISFLCKYWIIMMLYVIFGLLTQQEFPQISNLLLNAFGIGNSPVSNGVNVSFAWYVFFYIISLAVLPILLMIRNKSILSLSMAILIIVWSVVTIKFSYINSEIYDNLMRWPLPALFIGVCCGMSCNAFNLRKVLMKNVSPYFMVVSFVSLLVVLLYFKRPFLWSCFSC